MRVWLFALSAACALVQCCFPESPAQSESVSSSDVPQTAPFTAEMLSSYNGQTVAAIEVAGQPSLKTTEFTPLLLQKKGQPFSQQDVEQTAAAIKSKGKFEAVRIQIEPETSGIRVLFIPEPAIYFGLFEFPGAGRFPYPRLLQVANFPEQRAFNKTDVEQARRALISFLNEQGYFHATVQPQVQVDARHGIANVLFDTELGIRAKFDSTEIEGLPQHEASTYERKLQSVWARARGAAIRPGRPYHYATVTRAQRYIQHLLQARDLLSAQVTLTGAEYNLSTNQSSIHFKVTPGVPTHVRIEGAHLWRWTRKSLLPFYQGVGVDTETVEEGRQALLSHFQDQGYFDAAVQSKLVKNAKDNTVIYQVTKGKKYKAGEVTLSGNAHIPSSVLVSGIEVKKAHLFLHGKFSQNLVSQSVTNLTNIYKSEGYDSAHIRSKVVSNGRKVQVHFDIVEGPRDIVNSLTIEGNHTFRESDFAPNGLNIAAGKPYSRHSVEADRGNITQHYLNAGYMTSSFRETASEVSKQEPTRINVTYSIYEGPRVKTGNLIALGRQQTQQRLIDEDLSSLRPGTPLTESEMLRAGTELYNHPGVFDWAEVDPKRPVTTQSREDVLVKVHEAKRNDFTYGIGFEVINRGGSLPSGTVALPSLPPVGLPSNFTTSQKTFYGPRGTAQYTRNNIYGKGDSLSLTAFAGRLDQRGAVYLISPKIFWEAWQATTSLSIEKNEENPIFSYQQGLGSFQLQKPIDRSKRDLLFLRYSLNKTSLTRIVISQLVPEEDRNVRLSTLAANLTRDTRDNPLNEHSGVLRSLELDFNTKTLGSSVNFAKAVGQAAFYKQKFGGTVWAESIRIGLEQPFANSFVPLSDKFFTGGGNSLRGFPLDGAGPQRPVEICTNGASACACPGPDCSSIQVPTGGNELLILNSEARIPLPFMSGLSVVPFYDGGNAFPNVGFRDFLSLYSNNAGLGLRYNTPVGPIRFDIGRNLNPIRGINATQYFVSIGQAF